MAPEHEPDPREAILRHADKVRNLTVQRGSGFVVRMLGGVHCFRFCWPPPELPDVCGR